MSKKPTIIMPIEISQRELLPKVHLALEAAKRNYRVYLCDFLAARALFTNTEIPVIFFHKSTWEKQVKIVRNHGHKFVFLDEEMGLAIPTERLKETLYNRWGRHVTSDKYDALFAIGPQHKDFGAQVISDNSVPVYDTGWPRFDLWRPEIAAHLSKTESPHPRKYHLFASSFGATKASDFTAQLNKIAQRAPQSIQGRNDREQSFYLCLPVLREFAQFLEKEETDLIIRPHNSESPDEWTQLFKDYSNVYIRTGGDLYSWLVNAECVLHATSTVGIQSALTGKTPIALCPVGNMKKTLQYSVSREAFDLNAVLNCRKSFNQPSDVNDIHQMIAGFKGQTAAQNILDRLDDLRVDSQLPLKLTVRQYLKLLAYNLAIAAGKNIPLINNLPLNEKHKAIKKYSDKLEGGIKKNQVLDAVVSLSKAHGISPRKVVVQSPVPQAFSIEYSK